MIGLKNYFGQIFLKFRHCVTTSFDLSFFDSIIEFFQSGGDSNQLHQNASLRQCAEQRRAPEHDARRDPRLPQLRLTHAESISSFAFYDIEIIEFCANFNVSLMIKGDNEPAWLSSLLFLFKSA